MIQVYIKGYGILKVYSIDIHFHFTALLYLLYKIIVFLVVYIFGESDNLQKDIMLWYIYKEVYVLYQKENVTTQKKTSICAIQSIMQSFVFGLNMTCMYMVVMYDIMCQWYWGSVDDSEVSDMFSE